MKNIYDQYIWKNHLSKLKSNWGELPEKGIYNQNANHKKIKATFAHQNL